MPLNTQELMDRAREATGLSEFGDAPFQEGLELFVRALNEEAGLTPAPLEGARRMLIGALQERLRIEECLRRNPEILDQRIVAPLNLLGMSRSGTTALSQFLSEDPAMRSIRRWELATPTPPPDDAIGDADPRIAATRAAFEERDRRIPQFRTMLPISAEDPSEHNAPMAFTCLHSQWPTLYDIPSYEAWFLGKDITPGYEYLAKVLKILQWKTPRERWNLKHPMDIFTLRAFMNVFPDAILPWIHRDPVMSVGSTCSLVSIIRESSGQALDKKAFGRRILNFLHTGMMRGIRDREDLGLKVVDVYNQDLGRDPIGTISKLYDGLGLPFTAEYEQRLRDRMAQRPRGSHGKHSYTLEEFGLSVAEVRERFLPYTDRFKVPLEA